MNTAWEMAKRNLASAAAQRAETEFAVAREPITNYAARLQIALLNRLYQFCHANGAILIVLDIPGPNGSRDYSSSIPDTLVTAFRNSSDVLLLSDDVLGPYRGVATFTVPHGQRHITEFSHLMFGIAAARAITTSLHDIHHRDNAQN
jgi:hypothetical protein